MFTSEANRQRSRKYKANGESIVITNTAAAATLWISSLRIYNYGNTSILLVLYLMTTLMVAWDDDMKVATKREGVENTDSWLIN